MVWRIIASDHSDLQYSVDIAEFLANFPGFVMWVVLNLNDCYSLISQEWYYPKSQYSSSFFLPCTKYICTVHCTSDEWCRHCIAKYEK